MENSIQIKEMASYKNRTQRRADIINLSLVTGRKKNKSWNRMGEES
jgi:hypothetical protein